VSDCDSEEENARRSRRLPHCRHRSHWPALPGAGTLDAVQPRKQGQACSSGVRVRGCRIRAPIQRLDYENLDVYRCAIEYLAFAFEVIHSISVVLNIAEGAGKPSAPDRARFHAIARGSARECGARVDVCVIAGRVEPEAAERGKVLLVRIVSMLTRMCR